MNTRCLAALRPVAGKGNQARYLNTLIDNNRGTSFAERAS